MKLSKSKNANINYLAKIVEINDFKAHPNPEVTKLKCCSVDGFNIICGIDSESGIYVYFPTSCCLNPNFLSFANLYRHSSMNSNPDESGMFEDNGRVKAIKLKGCVSEGFILPVVILENFILSTTNKEVEYSINDEFDCVKEGDKEFWINKKYIPKNTISHNNRANENKKGKNNKKKISKIIDEQFRFHYDTLLIKKCPNIIQPDDLIHLSSKVHGTSSISAYVLCQPKPSKWVDLAIWLANHTVYALANLFSKNTKYSSTHSPRYDYVYASRTVIKNKYYNTDVSEGYYDYDVWAEADKILRPHMDKGMTLYYEIIGFLPNGGYIQKGYDYGYTQPDGTEYKYGIHFGIRIYRVTLTNVDGKVHEFSPREVQLWCNSQGLIPVTELYYGKAGDLYPELNGKENWSEEFINALSNDKRFYMECNSPECNNKVPHEGIVIKKDNMRSEAFKLKCFSFLSKIDMSEEPNLEDLS